MIFRKMLFLCFERMRDLKKKTITIVCLIENVLIVCICNHVSLINKITTVTWK